jgi:hypothetical protein
MANKRGEIRPNVLHTNFSPILINHAVPSIPFAIIVSSHDVRFHCQFLLIILDFCIRFFALTNDSTGIGVVLEPIQKLTK